MDTDDQLRTELDPLSGTERSPELAALAADLQGLVDQLEIDRLGMLRRNIVEDLQELRVRAERILIEADQDVSSGSSWTREVRC